MLGIRPTYSKIMFETSSKAGSLSRDKLDVVTQTNHLSHFLLTNLLKKCLVAAGNARVLNVSCQGYTKAVLDMDSLQREKQAGDWEQVYNSTKLMNVLFTEELAARWNIHGILRERASVARGRFVSDCGRKCGIH